MTHEIPGYIIKHIRRTNEDNRIYTYRDGRVEVEVYRDNQLVRRTIDPGGVHNNELVETMEQVSTLPAQDEIPQEVIADMPPGQ
jgi:hypothetical protein